MWVFTCLGIPPVWLSSRTGKIKVRDLSMEAVSTWEPKTDNSSREQSYYIHSQDTTSCTASCRGSSDLLFGHPHAGYWQQDTAGVHEHNPEVSNGETWGRFIREVKLSVEFMGETLVLFFINFLITFSETCVLRIRDNNLAWDWQWWQMWTTWLAVQTPMCMVVGNKSQPNRKQINDATE